MADMNQEFYEEMQKLKEHFDFETQIDETMALIFAAKDRETGETHEYRLTLSGLKDFAIEGNDLANKALADLKAKARDRKIGKLGI